MPRLSGTGPAQRAYHSLAVLAESYEVHLLVVGIKDRNHGDLSPPAVLNGPCVNLRVEPWRDAVLLFRMALQRLAPLTFERLWAIPEEWSSASPNLVRRASKAFSDVPFAAIHVFRLHMEPFAEPYREANPGATMQIDMDEVESSARRRLAALYQDERDVRSARRWFADARSCKRVEGKMLAHYHRVYVSSELERLRLAEIAVTAKSEVLPNVVDEPEHTAATGERLEPFKFLFVGDLAYFPNTDAVTFFSEKVLPRIQRNAGCAVEFVVVGGRAKAIMVRRWRRAEGVRHVGWVQHVAPYFRQADAVVVPLRAGGGTRIKILEAFARQVPVVATTVGAEGLGVASGKHLLLADDPEAFAEACLRLIAEPDLGSRLTRNAHALYHRSYRPSALRRVLLGRQLENASPRKGSLQSDNECSRP